MAMAELSPATTVGADAGAPADSPRTMSDLREWVRERAVARRRPGGAALRRHRDRARAISASCSKSRSTKRSARCPRGSPRRWRGCSGSSTEKDVTVSNIARYFEEVVADLTDKSHRDPKTKLLNFDWFMERRRVVPRGRAARPLVRRRRRRHHQLQVVQRHARPRGRRQDHRARRADPRPIRSGRRTSSRSSAAARRAICTRASAATNSAS